MLKPLSWIGEPGSSAIGGSGPLAGASWAVASWAISPRTLSNGISAVTPCSQSLDPGGPVGQGDAMVHT